MFRTFSVLVLFLVGCDKPDKPSGWDANQELRLVELEAKVDSLEREQREERDQREKLMNAAAADLKSIQDQVNRNARVANENARRDDARWNVLTSRKNP